MSIRVLTAPSRFRTEAFARYALFVAVTLNGREQLRHPRSSLASASALSRFHYF
jgi:hypothetical protein